MLEIFRDGKVTLNTKKVNLKKGKLYTLNVQS